MMLSYGVMIITSITPAGNNELSVVSVLSLAFSLTFYSRVSNGNTVKMLCIYNDFLVKILTTLLLVPTYEGSNFLLCRIFLYCVYVYNNTFNVMYCMYERNVLYVI